MENIVKDKTFDEERALYNLQNTLVQGCVFAGPADGESALKEVRNVEVEGCLFSLRYPLWHAVDFTLRASKLELTARAPLWYAKNGVIENCDIIGVKCLRECDNITLRSSRINSPEFGWRCRKIAVNDCELESEYLFFECDDLKINKLEMRGKYSFQYTNNVVIENAVLNTKDAFWHSKNVTVRNSVVNGEYLGWYSEGLTFENCKISGTQPLCYCKDLTLINCEMSGTDLSFEYSDVDASINGNVMSIKNPRSGKIVADSIDEIILEDSVFENNCEIIVRNK